MSLSDLDREDVETTADNSAGGKRWALRILGAVAALVVIAGLALIAWNNGVKQYLFPKKFGVVEPGRIYRSGQISAKLIGPTLSKYHIGLVIDLSMEDTPDSRAERQVEAGRNVPRLSLPLGGDGVGNPDFYVQALAAMIEADRSHAPVLVHCQAGTERTGGVVATYRILVEGKSEEQAFAEARSYGHSDRENPELVPFLKEHLEQWRTQLAAKHLIAN
ncbi:MAG TPA: dual specificity protein phosphatase family protein [Tepidisphaeraceae bacterium]|jgi:tyrosine-protein phosphatase SIW14|nr:dual specificity protein phosphatase family protein [Tepidisphaeraceae bacterium]